MTSLQEYLAREYALDVEEYRVKFATVPRSDPAALAAWFASYPFLTTHDMAQIAQVCPKTVYRWRRRANIRSRRIKPPHFSRRRRKLRAPANWDTDWLVEAYQVGYSTTELADATGRAAQTISERLKRRIELRGPVESIRSRNPCCTRQWVQEYYVERGLSQLRCSKLAGVSKYTFATWLDKFRVRVRSISEQALLNNDMGQRPRQQVGRKRQGPVV